MTFSERFSSALPQAPDKPPGRHEEDSVWRRSVPLSAVWGAAGLTWGQLSGVWGLQKGKPIRRRQTQTKPSPPPLKPWLKLKTHQLLVYKLHLYKSIPINRLVFVQHMCTKCGTQCGSRPRAVWLCKICREQREVSARHQSNNIKQTDRYLTHLFSAALLRCGSAPVPGSSKAFPSISCRHPCRYLKQKRMVPQRQQTCRRGRPLSPERQRANHNQQVNPAAFGLFSAQRKYFNPATSRPFYFISWQIVFNVYLSGPNQAPASEQPASGKFPLFSTCLCLLTYRLTGSGCF